MQLYKYIIKILSFYHEYSIMIEYTLTTNFVEVTVLLIYIEEQSISYESYGLRFYWRHRLRVTLQKLKAPTSLDI